MTSLTAADLQRKRAELEGAPDPFPSLSGAAEPQARSKPKQTANGSIDTDSTSAFPALAPSQVPAKAQPAVNAWGARPVVPIIRPSTFSTQFSLDAVDLSTAGKDGKRAANLSEVLKAVNSQFKVKIEASAQRTHGETTFILRGDSERDVDKAKRRLIQLLSPVVTLTVEAPVSAIAGIIGPKGANLNRIRDETGARIDIPRKAETNGVHKASEAPTRDQSPAVAVEEEEQEETVTISIHGSGPYAAEAKRMVEAIVSTKQAKSTQRIRNIPDHILPFIATRQADFEALGTSEGKASLSIQDHDAIVTGDRAAVVTIVTGISSEIDLLNDQLISLKMRHPKGQLRILGRAAPEFLKQNNIAIILPKDQSDEITLWGRAADLPNALVAIQKAAAAWQIKAFTVPGDNAEAARIFTYLTRIGYNKTLTAAHEGVTVYAPAVGQIGSDRIVVELLGNDKKHLEDALADLTGFVNKLQGATRSVEIDWLLHRQINTKFSKKLKTFHDVQHVSIYFPPETAESSKILLVYDPNADPSERVARLDEVSAELQRLAKEIADLRTETIRVDSQWHPAVIGKSGTTLNAIIGADTTLTIKLGEEAAKLAGDKSGNHADLIAVRGTPSEVSRALADIKRIVQGAENGNIEDSHSAEFTISSAYIGRIVGSQGSAINRLRDLLGVEIDFDDMHDGEKEVSKKKKSSSTATNTRVTIKGRKENVEEAKKRILAQVEKLADETSEKLKIPREYHSSLIGRGAKYVTRLEEKYSVKITFPRDGEENGDARGREALKTDEVLIKGGRKGVADAKKELMDAVEFEKESNNSITFKVPTRSVPRILGKGGVVINEIKDSTGAQIDIDKNGEGDGSQTVVTLRGTKQAIGEAKTAIKRIADEVDDETLVIMNVEAQYHRNLIGRGGQDLHDLIVRAGGPVDVKAQAGLVHFPRANEPVDEVRLRGPKAIVAKLQAEIEKALAVARDRVVLGVAIPAPQHRVLIGRGGQTLNALQDKHNVKVQFPGSRAYDSAGDLDNSSEMAEVSETDLVKVIGPRKAVQAAIDEMLRSAQSTLAPTRERFAPAASSMVEETIEIPLKYHHAIGQGGQFFRSLRTNHGARVEHSEVPPRPSPPRPPVGETGREARIDDVEGEGASVSTTWLVTNNYIDGPDGVATWTIKAENAEGLARARSDVEQALENAVNASHVGFLTVSDRSAFPRIVGAKGSNVVRLRAETGAEITVGRDDNVIVIVGTEQAIHAAKDAIERIISTRSRPPRGH